MNILLATSAAPPKSPFFTNEKSPPLGVGFLISLLRSAGHNVFFIDNYLNPTPFIEDGFLEKNQIHVVGIHTNTICYRDSLRVFEQLETLRVRGLWKGKIVVGGPHTSVAPATIPEFVDHVVQGEGEQAILDIMNGSVKERMVRKERIKDLDSLPFQPWDVFTRLPYEFFCPWLDARPVFTLTTSRGCPFDCSFCSVRSIWGTQCSFFSAERILSEVEHLVSIFGAKGIYFREDNFTLSGKRIERFCEMMLKKRLDVQWACETRVETLCDDAMVYLMGQAGCRAVYLGVESGSQRILDLLNKKITVEQIEKAVGLCKKHNIRAYCSLLTGVPEETYEDYRMTEALMKKLKPYAYAFNVYVGIPTSPLYQDILDSNAYEYEDELGLLYLPGFDVRTRYFYGKKGHHFVDHNFVVRTDFEKRIRFRLYKREIETSMRRRVPAFLKPVRRGINVGKD